MKTYEVEVFVGDKREYAFFNSISDAREYAIKEVKLRASKVYITEL